MTSTEDTPTALPPVRGNRQRRPSLLAARTQRLFDVLVAEDETDLLPNFQNESAFARSKNETTFLDRMKAAPQDHNRYHDFTEGEKFL